jgi:hypothetical protein
LKTNAYGTDSLEVPAVRRDAAGSDPAALAGDAPLVKSAKFSWRADWYIEVPLSTSGTARR